VFYLRPIVFTSSLALLLKEKGTAPSPEVDGWGEVKKYCKLFHSEFRTY
jgi:hypothetical protein